jgi:ABC-2 type transport system permease protein
MSAGQIHDLGYKRYAGSRRARGTRWTVIMRHQIATGWKTWWRFKIWLVFGLLATAIPAALLYVFSTSVLRMFRGLGSGGAPFIDSILPLSLIWYCWIGFFASLFLAAPAVAGDIQSGAFTFYFARSLRPRDYVIGKIIGLSIVLSLVMLGGPLVLAGVRLGLAEGQDDLIALLPILAKAIAIGVLGTLIYAVVPLGFSALVSSRTYALAIWAAYYMLIGSLAQGLGFITHPAVAALDLPTALGAVARDLFEVHMNRSIDFEIPAGIALASILVHVAAATGVMLWRVRTAQQRGVGGSS